MSQQLLIKDSRSVRLVNLHPSFFARDKKLSIGRKAMEFAQDTTPLFTDVLIKEGTNVFYEKHFRSEEKKTKPVGRTPEQKQRVKEFKKLLKEFKFTVKGNSLAL